jgi:hypothetical protein
MLFGWEVQILGSPAWDRTILRASIREGRWEAREFPGKGRPDDSLARLTKRWRISAIRAACPPLFHFRRGIVDTVSFRAETFSGLFGPSVSLNAPLAGTRLIFRMSPLTGQFYKSYTELRRYGRGPALFFSRKSNLPRLRVY